MHRFFWIIAGFFLLLAGCVSGNYYSETVHSWHGATTKSLFARWGYPNRIARMPKGRRILIYRKTETPHVPTQGIAVGAAQCTAWFEVDKKQRVIHTRYQGSDCRASKSFFDKYANE